MRMRSEKMKIIYLVIMIFFISASGIIWLDYIGLLDISDKFNLFRGKPELVTDAAGDEPSLIDREKLEKEQQALNSREEGLNKREALLKERENELATEQEKLAEQKKGLEIEQKKLADRKNEHAGYEKNIKVLADKIANMPPEESVKIMTGWDDPVIIDVLRQMDVDAAAAGSSSITSYLITLMPKEKASRVMYLMTQL
ncbi:MAG: hypothetical protein FWG13_05870 [Leptospirales bacterium]|nr:hypothetical protein [Leptospirales bacterium]